MKRTFVKGLVALSIVSTSSAQVAQKNTYSDVEKILRSVCRITDERGTGGGSCILVLCRRDSTHSAPALVSSAHVFDSIKTNNAIVFLRKRDSLGSFEVVPDTIQIRRNGKPLYERHPLPEIDLAAILFYVPKSKGEPDWGFIDRNAFVNDSYFSAQSIGAGDHVLFAGFPGGLEGTAKFPIISSAVITSHPLIPSSKYSRINIEGSIYPGNSGGPVFIPSGVRYANGTLSQIEGCVIGVMEYVRPARIPLFDKKADTVIGYVRYLTPIGGAVNSSYVDTLFSLLGCGRSQ